MVGRSKKIFGSDLPYGIGGLSDRPTHGVFMYEEWDDEPEGPDHDYDDFGDDYDLTPAHREHLNEANGSDEDEWEEEEVDEEEEGEEEEGDEEDRFSKMDDDDKWRRGYFYTGLK
jgi:hypothetical protein